MSAALPSHSRPLAPLTQRRRYVGLAIGGYALAILCYLAYELIRGNEWPFVIGSLVGMTLAAFGAIQLMTPARLGLPQGRDHSLDERQWQQLSRAHMTAYRILGVIFMLATLYFYLAHRNAHLPLPAHSYAWATIWLGAVLFIPALPTMILAWTEPDPLD